MNLKYFTLPFLLLTFSVFNLKAQHCPFDLGGIVVVRIHLSSDTSVIPNLKVTMLNSPGNRESDGNFWQNQSATTLAGYIDNNNPPDSTRINFPFAKDNYVLVCHISTKFKNCKIKIEDIDGIENSGYFETVIIQPSEIKVYSLCGYWLKTYLDLKPIDITLTKK